MDTILSGDRIQTYSDGILTIHDIEPSDHGSYACIISTASSASVRSKPAIITVKCRFKSFNLMKKFIICQ